MTKKTSKGIHRTERTNNQKMVEWINDIVTEKNLPLGYAEQETTGPDRKQPDIIIRRAANSNEILCVVELKNPAFLDVFQEEELVEPARKKATRRQAPYFATSNFRELVLFNTARANQMEPLEKQIIQRYTLSDAEDPDDIENRSVSTNIRRGLDRFLSDLIGIALGHISEPRHPIDEILIMRLQAAIRALSWHYRDIIEHNANTDKDFIRKLRKWFLVQGWSFSKQRDDYDKAARQTAYLLVSKVLFYSAIQPIRRLDPLQIPKDLTKGSLLRRILQAFFDEVLKIDYQTIYTTDFIDQIAFPEDYSIVGEIKEIVNVLACYDFSKIGYDILGRIFEKLIPENERRLLGQYFTNPDIVDLILRFTLRHEKDTILDPGCGAGTFLVRGYQQKKLMNQRLTHEELLKDIWGIDISRFPALLATINLAINDLRSNENYPRIIRGDFFDLIPATLQFGIPSNAPGVQIGGLSEVERSFEHPKTFDIIVGNPPYTRHLQIEDIQNNIEDYKNSLRGKALTASNGKILADISKRAGIYAYFFVHGTKFLANGGRLGFIVSNSWLDADYGKGLQQHFLEHYKIVTIIESNVERWFEDADINTCIVILDKAAGEGMQEARRQNVVRFVNLKKPLRHFVPMADNMWEKEIGRRDAFDALIRTIMGHSAYYENDDLRIYPRQQQELWDEGYDTKNKKYIGGKWGIYIRAPEIYFKVLSKIERFLVPLSSLGDVNEGKATGAEEFFYPDKKVADKYGIEPRYLRPAILKPRGKNLFELKEGDIDNYFLTAEESPEKLKGTKVIKYIRYGENKRLHTGASFANKDPWYSFGVRKPADLIMSRGVGSRHYCALNSAKAMASGSFTEIRLYDYKHGEATWLFLNSSMGWLIIELLGRSAMGGGMLKVDPTDIRKMRVIDPSLVKRSLFPELDSLLNRRVDTVEQECNAKDHRLVDDYILGDVLGLTECEQQEVRRNLIELVQARNKKASSVKNGKKSRNGIDLDKLTLDVIHHEEVRALVRILKTNVIPKGIGYRRLPAFKGPVTIENTLLGWQINNGAATVECKSELEARFLRVFLEMRWDEAPVLAKGRLTSALITKLESHFESANSILDEYNSAILQRRIRDRLTRIFWAHVKEEVSKDG